MSFFILSPHYQVFGTISKVYASSGEPCCAECVTPVFNDAWNPRASVKTRPSLPLSAHQEETESEVAVSQTTCV